MDTVYTMHGAYTLQGHGRLTLVLFLPEQNNIFMQQLTRIVTVKERTSFCEESGDKKCGVDLGSDKF